MTMKEIDKVWLAALIDGEGCISMPRTKYIKSRYKYSFGIRIVIGNTCLDLIKHAHKICKVGTICKMKRKNRKYKQAFLLQIVSKQAAQILMQIKYQLIAKKRQAILAIKAQKLISSNTGYCHSCRRYHGHLNQKQLNNIYYKLKAANS